MYSSTHSSICCCTYCCRQAGEAPFNQAVDELHGKYVAALQKLFDDWKDKLAPNRKGDMRIVA